MGKMRVVFILSLLMSFGLANASGSYKNQRTVYIFNWSKIWHVSFTHVTQPHGRFYPKSAIKSTTQLEQTKIPPGTSEPVHFIISSDNYSLVLPEISFDMVSRYDGPGHFKGGPYANVWWHVTITTDGCQATPEPEATFDQKPPYYPEAIVTCRLSSRYKDTIMLYITHAMLPVPVNNVSGYDNSQKQTTLASPSFPAPRSNLP